MTASHINNQSQVKQISQKWTLASTQ